MVILPTHGLRAIWKVKHLGDMLIFMVNVGKDSIQQSHGSYGDTPAFEISAYYTESIPLGLKPSLELTNFRPSKSYGSKMSHFLLARKAYF